MTAKTRDCGFIARSLAVLERDVSWSAGTDGLSDSERAARLGWAQRISDIRRAVETTECRSVARGLIADALGCIEGLAEQQAMGGDWWEGTAKRLSDYLAKHTEQGHINAATATGQQSVSLTEASNAELVAEAIRRQWNYEARPHTFEFYDGPEECLRYELTVSIPIQATEEIKEYETDE